MPNKQQNPKTNEATSEQVEEKPKSQRVIWKGEREPHKKVQIGMLVIDLPSADEQRKGFETEHARELTSIRGYKRLTNKG
jgi:hypothetical protein